MSDIFISYASEDRGRVQPLARALEREGWSVWWDRHIRTGQSFDEAIQEALDASKAVVVVWTKTSVKSQWVKNEAREGLRRRVLFPVMLREEVKIPLEFGHIQSAQLMDWQPEQAHSGLNQFVQDLARILGPPSGAAVQPPPVKPPQAQPPSQPIRNPESEPPLPPTQSQRYILIGIGLLLAMGLAAYGIWSQGSSSITPIVKSDKPPSKQSQETTPPPTPTAPEKPSTSTVQDTPTVTPDTAEVRATATQPRPIVGPAKTITGKDGAPMVLIPAGEFRMGSPDGEGDKGEHPRHSVALSAFYLDKYEVSNRFFQQFVQQTSHQTTAEQEGTAVARTAAGKWEEVRGAHWRKPEGAETVFDSNREEHPVVSVSWADAQAYCRWAGKRPPTEAEFEYATRAGTKTKYWWGDGHPGSRPVANVADESLKRQYSNWAIMTGYDDGYVHAAPVGSFEANPFGLHDMTGNVSEWTADWYDEQYYKNSSRKNPQGPSKRDYKVVRGGSWGDGVVDVRSADRNRYTPADRVVVVGFRCAQDRQK